MDEFKIEQLQEKWEYFKEGTEIQFQWQVHILTL
jgi:hypothetical protein